MGSVNVFQLILSVLLALGGGGTVIALLKIRATKRAIEADTGATVAGTIAALGESAQMLVDPLTRAVERLNAQLVASQSEVMQLRMDLDDARREIRGAKAEAHEAMAQVQAAKAEVAELHSNLKKCRAENDRLIDLKIPPDAIL